MVRMRTGRPARGRNCFGMAAPMRLPLPPATIIASLSEVMTRYDLEDGAEHEEIEQYCHDNDAEGVACDELSWGMGFLV